ncbi:hypothetical protein HU200_045261 [Digitaria exilis]|uniref:HECT-type E3 ubiquitin transferase n=1 Tax=Digitaria exilis TaxID=1010633 RepID=A0A835B0T0_9POAL|nr:hypothetical protein HU200_045261 [Digitaria exilis]
MQVSLRGSSAREITRDALLQKVSEERQLRSHLRRAAAAALSIQHKLSGYVFLSTATFALTFLFVSSFWTDMYPFSVDANKNFCSFAVGMPEDRSVWLYQAKNLISLCCFILARCGHSCYKDGSMVDMTAVAMRLAVSLTDCKTWKSLKSENARAADASAESLIEFIGTYQSGTYNCVRQYIKCLGPHVASGKKSSITATDDHFLITASAITLALRPFHSKKEDRGPDLNVASKEYFTLILTIPYLCKRLPPMLLPALKHSSVLQPCLNILLVRISKDRIFEEMIKLEQSEVSPVVTSVIPCSGWALGNIVNLATNHDDLLNSGCFIQGLDFCLYVEVINCISQNILEGFEKSKGVSHSVGNTDFHDDTSVTEEGGTSGSCSMRTLFMDLLKPIYQQWHLRKLLMLAKEDASCNMGIKYDPVWTLKLSDVVCFYYHMLRIFSSFNPSIGALPILNMLAFSPGFLVDLWGALETSIFGQAIEGLQETGHVKQLSTNSSGEHVSSTRQRRNAKDTATKWANVLQKITGKSNESGEGTMPDSILVSQQSNDDALALWDIEAMRHASEGTGDDLMCMIYLFCAIYGHLLLVLDDIEFYEKQVPFTLEQQRKIASALNTFVYNSFVRNGGSYNKPLLDVAVRCVNLLYERDSRHKFCPISLWLAPARNGRIPIAAAARAHEAALGNFPGNSSSAIPTRSSVLTTLPHVYPFEERVQMFREFIESDKASRRVTGEVSGPGPGSIEIVIRRGHIIEDGYRQLNCLRSKLKSCIHVSFVSECGLPEAGLDYGGLSKEFLTDLSKTAFSPEYGLFSQTSESDTSLIPSNSAKLLDNGIDMIEFLGRVVGKALYEGILLDYSFSQVFVQKLLGRYNFLDELSTLDPELYRNLMQLKHYDGNVEDLCLDFTVTEELGGKRIVHELKPGGRSISVTNENKLHYVHAMADFKLNRQLLSGGLQDFDVDDLRNNTKYTGGYTESSRTVKLFWEVPCDVTLWASIGGQDVDRLPSASTCYNTLKLPTYKRSSTLRSKLLYAISSNAGFELS